MTIARKEGDTETSTSSLGCLVPRHRWAAYVPHTARSRQRCNLKNLYMRYKGREMSSMWRSDVSSAGCNGTSVPGTQEGDREESWVTRNDLRVWLMIGFSPWRVPRTSMANWEYPTRRKFRFCLMARGASALPHPQWWWNIEWDGLYEHDSQWKWAVGAEAERLAAVRFVTLQTLWSPCFYCLNVYWPLQSNWIRNDAIPSYIIGWFCESRCPRLSDRDILPYISNAETHQGVRTSAMISLTTATCLCILSLSDTRFESWSIGVCRWWWLRMNIISFCHNESISAWNWD